MCRLYGMIASDPTKVECTLIHAQNALMIQSRSDRSGRSHTDGWGISYYSNGLPHLERRATAAFSDLHFATTAEKVYAHTVVAHVRRATVGAVSLQNTHPFTYRQWSFAHNGTVSAFADLEARLLSEFVPRLRPLRVGETDSETAFLWLLSRLNRAGCDIDSVKMDCPRMVEEFNKSVSWLAGECLQIRPDKVPRLNFLVTNGQMLLASRLNRSLFWVERDGIHDCEICGIPHIHARHDHPYRAVVVASEPITDETWREIPEAHVLLVTPGLRVRLAPLRVDSGVSVGS